MGKGREEAKTKTEGQEFQKRLFSQVVGTELRKFGQALVRKWRLTTRAPGATCHTGLGCLALRKAVTGPVCPVVGHPTTLPGTHCPEPAKVHGHCLPLPLAFQQQTVSENSTFLMGLRTSPKKHVLGKIPKKSSRLNGDR